MDCWNVSVIYIRKKILGTDTLFELQGVDLTVALTIPLAEFVMQLEPIQHNSLEVKKGSKISEYMYIK